MLPLIPILLSSLFAASAPVEIHQSCESVSPNWPNVKLIDDGYKDHALRFAAPDAHADLGPCPVDSTTAFTLKLALRTTDSAFNTALMARDGEAVGLSIILGREPGRVSFEAWSWQNIKLISTSRIDDGKWHLVQIEYEPESNVALLSIDGRTESWAALGKGASPTANLRLGNNIGVDQPFRGDLDELDILPSVAKPDRFASLAPITSSTDKARDLAELRAYLLPPRTPIPDTPEALAAQKAVVRSGVANALGLTPYPPRRPLDFQSHGEKIAGGVKVERVTWSSWPGYRATGWLWTAEKQSPGRHPAMLMPHGHWANGALEDVVQVRAARFARAGYIVLVPDSVHVEDLASGVNTVGVMTWNNIRALDLLCERPDVDPARIGCTGASGGAQQTMYLMALEDRLAAAAPVCMICYYNEILGEHFAHCACNHVPGVASVTDQPGMCAVFAPRPALFISATGDWTHNFPTQGWPEIQSFYSTANAASAAHQQQFHAGHGYDGPMRSAVYAFFDPLLSPPNPSATEADFTAFPVSTLAALGPPNRVPDRVALAAEHAARRPSVSTLRELAPKLTWSPRVLEPGNLGPVAPDSPWNRYTITGPDNVALPFLARGVLWDGPDAEVKSPDDNSDILVVLPADSRAPLLLNPPDWLTSAKRVVILEPRFRGEWREFADGNGGWRRNAIILGRGEGYQAAVDIAQIIQSIPGDGKVTVVALGPTGVEALLALGGAPRIHSLIIDNLGPSFTADGNRDPQCPGILRFGDLDKLIATARPDCTLTIGGSTLGKGPKPLDADQIKAALYPAH